VVQNDWDFNICYKYRLHKYIGKIFYFEFAGKQQPGTGPTDKETRLVNNENVYDGTRSQY